MTRKQIIKNRQSVVIPFIKFYINKSRYKLLNIRANFVNLNLLDKKYVLVSYDNVSKELELHFIDDKKNNAYKLGKGIISKTISANAILKSIDCDVAGKEFRLEYVRKDTLVANLSEPMEQ